MWESVVSTAIMSVLIGVLAFVAIVFSLSVGLIGLVIFAAVRALLHLLGHWIGYIDDGRMMSLIDKDGFRYTFAECIICSKRRMLDRQPYDAALLKQWEGGTCSSVAMPSEI